MTDLVAAVAIAVILGAAIAYIVKAKKSGKKCLGCPVTECSSKDSGSCCCTCSADLRINPDLLKKER